MTCPHPNFFARHRASSVILTAGAAVVLSMTACSTAPQTTMVEADTPAPSSTQVVFSDQAPPEPTGFTEDNSFETETDFDGRQAFTTDTLGVNVYGDLPVNMQPIPTLHAIETDAEDNLTRVTYSPVGGDFDPHMSPNGKFLVYSSTQHRPTSDIYVKSIEGRSVTQLTADPGQDIMPVFSPDGQRIAFASDRSGSWDIYVMSIAGGQPLQVTSDDSHELHASWSPDGSMLAYSRLSTQTGRWELWVADMNNAGVRKFIGYGLFPEWSPNPAVPKISFQRARERDSRLFSIWTIDFIDGEGVNATEVASSANAALINPTWSPDASHIVFAATVDSADDGTTDMPEIADLWMIEHDGSNRVNLTDGRFACLMPTWGTDNKIYFVANREGVDNIWSIGPTRGLLASASMTFDETTTTVTASVPEGAVVGQE